jgi:acetolactate synthase-1/2/3 large subunit
MPELDRVLFLDGPALVQVDVDPEQGFEPRIKSRMREDGTFSTPELDDMYPFLSSVELESVRGCWEQDRKS